MIPWLAIGVGLAGLVGVPNGALTSPAAADARPVRVATIDGTMLHLTHATSSSDVPPIRVEAAPSPRLPTNVSEQFQAAERIAGHAEVPTFRHPLLGAEEPPISRGPRSTQHAAPSASPAAWAELRWCESSGDYTAVSVTGTYRGAYQLDHDTWESYGGVGDPIDASAAEQDRVAAELFANRGTEPWPYCGRYLG